MTKDQFISVFVPTYLAMHVLNQQIEGNTGWQLQIVDNPPVEDAAYIAQRNWAKLVELCPKICDQ